MDNENTNPSTETQQNEGQPTEKTYTEAEFQSEIDRRVSQALATERRKSEAKVKEAEKLAKMNESEKYEYQLQQREAAITAKEKELALAENKNVASQILSEKGISLSLVDFVVAEDADTMKSNIDILDRAFKQSVKDQVLKQMAGSTPKKNSPPVNKPIDAAAFKKMGYEELMDLKNSDPELFRQLSQ